MKIFDGDAIDARKYWTNNDIRADAITSDQRVTDFGAATKEWQPFRMLISFSGKRILLTGRGPSNNIKRPHSFEVAGQVRNGTISAAGVHVNEGRPEPAQFPCGILCHEIGPFRRNRTHISPLCSLQSFNKAKKCRPTLIRHAPLSRRRNAL